jgi:hypothetical protein
MQSRSRKSKSRNGMNERLKRRVKQPSPPGVRRPSTIAPKRNMIVVDFGDDVHGVRRRLEEKSKLESRTISSIVREILKRTLIDW